MIEITLPWPDRRLSPNARVHWAQKARAAKRAREHAYWTARAIAGDTSLPDGPIEITLQFCPPDRHQRDHDNLIAIMKPSIDGVAQALGVDDSRFRYQPVEVGDVVKGGVVVVRVDARGA